MIFLIGTKDSNIKNGILLDVKCPNCESKDSLNFSIYRKYTHLTSIPLFPVGKHVYIECNQCKSSFDYEDLPENIQQKLKNEKLKSSIWMFSGTIIIILFLIFTLNNYFQKKDETSVLIKTPTEGDVYSLKFSDGYYSTMKIDKVTRDSIYTTHNNFNAYMPYEIDDLDKAENYSNRQINYSKKEIVRLYKNDEIINISRRKQSENQELKYKIPL